MNKKTIKDIKEQLKGKRVFVRCDFNVPLDENRQIVTDDRIVESINTLKYLLDRGARVIACSHLGRPKGYDESLSLKPVRDRLSQILGKEVILAKDVVGEDAKSKINAMQDGDIVLLENVRFHPEEEKNEPEFSGKLAELADIYVNDAFGTAHRAHSSTAGIVLAGAKKGMPAVAGFLIEKEIEIMGKALENPNRPFVAILGGSKVSDKINVIKNILKKSEAILIGGGMAYTFLLAKGINVGNSIKEEDKIDLAKDILEDAAQRGVKILLPIDHIAAVNKDSEPVKIDDVQIPDGLAGLDIGPKTIDLFKKEIESAKTIIWNGPLGLFEKDDFANGTMQVARALAKSDAVTIIGGGDSAAAVKKADVEDDMTHVSTGGGASLEFLEGKVLPGIDVLNDN